MSKIKDSVQYIKGVGPKKSQRLNRLNIGTIEDILYFFPREYEDRRETKKIINLEDGEKTNIEVILESKPSMFKPNRKISITKVMAKDDTGLVQLVWFNQPYVIKQLGQGDQIKLNGRVKKSGMITEIHNPVYIKSDEKSDKLGKILPIYNLTEKLKNNEMIKIVDNVLDDYLKFVKDTLPDYVVERYKLLDLHKALRNIHFPTNRNAYIMSRNRLVFEELFTLQLGLLLLKSKSANDKEYIEFKESHSVKEFIEDLPFTLTNAQQKVFEEISKDMKSKKQMNRLVQGDVGSGKTVIAVAAMFKAFKSGYQSVMMAPTEILAQQHLESISELFKAYEINCELLASSVTKKNKEKIIERVKSGQVHILIGTHALIEDYVEFKNLGLAITDEQHRFGVRQRAKLSSKGKSPDILIMTATPIPRTLSLIVHGDLDVSIIDELPPGRKKIETFVRNDRNRDDIYEFTRRQITEGRQIYIVCPLVEESETLNIKSATELYEDLSEGVFKDFRVSLLHGKMKPKEKDKIMIEFKNNESDILVSTTVIEVGVNVPNASVMIIENSERFGLAQLHQLRGRIGRGQYQSYCILMNQGKGKVAKQRMDIMEKTNDGFLISEKDLEIRGPGEFFGIRQHGLPELKISQFPRDMEILKAAQSTSLEIIEKDPELELDEHKGIKAKVKDMFNNEDLIIFN